MRKLKKIAKVILNRGTPVVNTVNIDSDFLKDKIVTSALPGFFNYSFKQLKLDTLHFINSIKTPDADFSYKYSVSSKSANIYSSVYACLLLSMLGEFEVKPFLKKQWAEYFNNFQNSEDGLFYEDSLNNEI